MLRNHIERLQQPTNDNAISKTIREALDQHNTAFLDPGMVTLWCGDKKSPILNIINRSFRTVMKEQILKRFWPAYIDSYFVQVCSSISSRPGNRPVIFIATKNDAGKVIFRGINNFHMLMKECCRKKYFLGYSGIYFQDAEDAVALRLLLINLEAQPDFSNGLEKEI